MYKRQLRDEQKKLAGFMGIGQGKLEMLFLAPEQMGKGSGSRLVQYGIDGFGIREAVSYTHLLCYYRSI